MKLIFATGNAHKLEEVQAVLGESYTLITPAQVGITEEIPEEAPTLEGNALQKARYLYERTGESCFADDTGLEVEALEGAPGVYSARYAGEAKSSEDNMDLLLKNLAGKENRRARFRTVIALILNGVEYLFEGEVQGEITLGRSGEKGFGYDPIFCPEGLLTTFAQMPAQAKNEISHRGRAVQKLAQFLADNPPQ